MNIIFKNLLHRFLLSMTASNIRKLNKCQQAMYVEFAEAIKNEIFDPSEIGKHLDLSRSTIVQYASKVGIKFRKVKRKRVEQETRLDHKKIEELSKLLNLTHETIARYAKDAGIPAPKNVYSGANEAVIATTKVLAQQDLTQEQIGSRLGVTKERARQLLHAANSYEIWAETRLKAQRERNRKKLLLQQLTTILSRRIRDLCVKGSESQRLAIQYIERYPNSPYKPHELTSLFENYLKVRRSESRVSLNTLTTSRIRDLSAVGKILEAVGLRDRRIRRLVSEYEQNLIDRCYDSEFPATDVGYFAGIPAHVVKSRFQKTSKKSRTTRRVRKFRTQQGIVPFRTSSQIYEATDIGINSTQDISDLIAIDQTNTEFAIEHRSTIEPMIIKGLKIMYPNNEITKPYLN